MGLYFLASLCLVAWFVFSLKKAGSFRCLAKELGEWAAAWAVVIIMMISLGVAAFNGLMFVLSRELPYLPYCIIATSVLFGLRAWVNHNSGSSRNLFSDLPPLTRPGDLPGKADTSWSEMKTDGVPKPARGRSWDKKD